MEKGDGLWTAETVEVYSSPLENVGLKGLRNIGNTCFMNSVLQCLSNTRPLLEYVLITKEYLADVNTTTSSMKGNLVKAFGKVIQDLWTDGRQRDVDTCSLKGHVQRLAPIFRGKHQHDSQEFLRYFLKGLHSDLNRVAVKPKASPIQIQEGLEDAEKSHASWLHYQKYDNSKVVNFSAILISTRTSIMQFYIL